MQTHYVKQTGNMLNTLTRIYTLFLYIGISQSVYYYFLKHAAC